MRIFVSIGFVMGLLLAIGVMFFPTSKPSHAVSDAQMQRMKDLLAQENARKFRVNRDRLTKLTRKLEKQARKDQREAKRGRYTKRVDREYIKLLEKHAKMGSVGEWKETNAEYKAERNKAIAKDKVAAEKKKPKTWTLPPLK